MSDVDGASVGLHPGQQIRAAREARGQTLAHLSVLLKISERRLQAFEEGRWAEVGDTTFVRVLAKSLARHLALDPDVLLQALPQSTVAPRYQADGGRLPDPPALGPKTLGTPVSLSELSGGSRLFSPVRLAVLLILVGAVGLVLVPAASWEAPTEQPPVGAAEPPLLPASSPASAPETAASAATDRVAAEPSAAASSVVVLPIAVPSASPPASVPPPLPVITAGPLQVQASQDTWVQVTDARGQVLLSRLLRPGERVDVDGQRPLRVRVGNVAGTEVVWLGRPVPLQDIQRSNVADLQLP